MSIQIFFEEKLPVVILGILTQRLTESFGAMQVKLETDENVVEIGYVKISSLPNNPSFNVREQSAIYHSQATGIAGLARLLPQTIADFDAFAAGI
jgi:hypothetical protein